MTTSGELPPIQMLWVRGALSRLELLSVCSFLAHGHPVHLYHYGAIPNVPAGVLLHDARPVLPEECAPSAPSAPFARGSLGSFSDIFRYHLLHDRGGWWSDMDFVCLRPWRFSQPALTASTDEGVHGQIANGCAMRFPAGHPVMVACREACQRLDARNADISHTGPLLLHRTMQTLGYGDLAVIPSVFCPVPWNAHWQLLRPLWRRFTLGEFKQRLRRPHLTMRFGPETVAVHLWNEMWRKECRDKNARGPRTCLYERLQRRWNA